MGTNVDYDVIIAGAGPAGTSAAINLATEGVQVLLVEQKPFPREKLCGEFISPECLPHFHQLGVATQMVSAGERLIETVFYSRSGHRVRVPSEWFGVSGAALGLSRSEMDNTLLRRAKHVGVDVMEGQGVANLLFDNERVTGVSLRSADRTKEYRSSVIIDATGRARALVRRLEGLRPKKPWRTVPGMVAFKAHLNNTKVTAGACEIYSYPGGYGGASGVEGGLTNLCFIVAAKDVRRCSSNPERVVREIVSQNRRASYTLAGAHTNSGWLSISLEGFGRGRLVPRPGLLTVGDAAAFIDPFTGSGILMALETGKLASQSICRHLERLKLHASFDQLARDYRLNFQVKFASRLRLCALLRRTAFVPYLSDGAIFLFGASDRIRRRLVLATRTAKRRGRRPAVVE